MKRPLTNKHKERITLRALADLFERDAVEIATDPRYAKPEGTPLPIVGELLRYAPEARSDAKRRYEK